MGFKEAIKEIFQYNEEMRVCQHCRGAGNAVVMLPPKNKKYPLIRAVLLIIGLFGIFYNLLLGCSLILLSYIIKSKAFLKYIERW